MSVVELKADRSESVKATTEKFLASAGNFDCVIILAIDKSGGQHIFGNPASMLEKSFLHQFFSAFLNRWFEGFENA